MTREEEKKQAALEYRTNTKEYDDTNAILIERQLAFEAGWEAADKHPKNPWRDTKKELPKAKHQVILKGWSGRNIYYESLTAGDVKFLKDNPEAFPYWTLIPETPKGGEI